MMHKLKIIAAIAILVVSSRSFADDGQAEATPDLSLVPKVAQPLYVDPVGKYQTPDQVKTGAFTNKLNLTEGGAAATASPSMTPFLGMAHQGQRQGDLSTEKDRGAVLRFLGMDPASGHQGQLYYFISLSMPLSLIQAYELDAMWTGGRLVLRGMDPAAPDLRTFIAKELMPLVQFKGGGAELSIDPRLFDTYQVTTVPSIVYSEISENSLCAQTVAQPFTVESTDEQGVKHSSTMQYQACSNLADPDKYWKLSGSVTTSYALAQFADAGAPVSFLQDAMKRAAGAGVPVSADASVEEQQGFSGDWSKVLTPSEMTGVEKAINGVGDQGGQQTYVFPTSAHTFGMATGPSGLQTETSDHQQVMVPIQQMLQPPAAAQQ